MLKMYSLNFISIQKFSRIPDISNISLDLTVKVESLKIIHPNLRYRSCSINKNMLLDNYILASEQLILLSLWQVFPRVLAI